MYFLASRPAFRLAGSDFLKKGARFYQVAEENGKLNRDSWHSQTVPHRCVQKYENTSEKDRTSTADSGTMPFGWTNTSKESGRNVGAASMHEPCANR